MFSIKNLHVSIDKNEILHGVDLLMKPGEIHAIMGPNGSGKTTLAMSIMGQPDYSINAKKSSIKIDGKDVISLAPELRARAGLFVSFQNPIEIPGVSFLAFIRTAAKSLRPDEKMPLSVFKEDVKAALRSVSLDESFMHRSMNEGFSGGEKKRAEIAQLLVLKPRYAILDEIDSGLDIDSLRIIATAISQFAKKNNTGILAITHYQRILRHMEPDAVHVFIDGRIKLSGDIELARKIEKEGYAAV